MKQWVLILLMALTLAAGAQAQSPGVVRFPNQLDTTTSLFELSNLASTTLSGGITSSATTINVASTTGFPNTGSITLNNTEIAFYTGKTGSSFTGVIRGQDGTTAVSHSSGVSVRQNIIARHLTALRDAIIALENKLGANTRPSMVIGEYVAPTAVFDIYVSNSGSKPSIRYNGPTSAWQYSNDGANYVPFGSGGSGTLTVNSQSATNHNFSVSGTAATAGLGSYYIDQVSGGSGDHVLYLADASTTQRGLLNIASNQDIIGTKTFKTASSRPAIIAQQVGSLTDDLFQAKDSGGSVNLSVSYLGNLSKVRGVPYTWPAAQASESAGVQALINDGSGGLSWARPKIKIQQNGTDINTGIATLNFTGAGVTASLNGSKIDVAIPGGAGGGDFIDAHLDYSADNTGATDATSSIQNAINAAASTATKSVKLPAGTYSVTGLSNPGGVNLVGDGKFKTKIKSTSDAPIISAVGGSGTFTYLGGSISDLTIEGSAPLGSSVTNRSNQVGIKVDDPTYAHDFKISNVWVINTGGHGIDVRRAFSTTFENIDVSNPDGVGYPINFDADGMPGNVFRDVYVHDVNATAPAGIRVRAGSFVCYTCNGIDSSRQSAQSWFIIVGRKSGVDGDTTNNSASARLVDSNLESFMVGGAKMYRNSTFELDGFSSVGGDGACAGRCTPLYYEVVEEDPPGSPIFYPNWGSKGRIASTVVFANSEVQAITGTGATTSGGSTLTGTGTSFTTQLVAGQFVVLIDPATGAQTRYRISTISSNTSLTITTTFASTATNWQLGLNYYKEWTPIHATSLPPLTVDGQGPKIASGGPTFQTSYYNTTRSRAEALYRADGYSAPIRLTGSYTFVNPPHDYIETACASNCNIVLSYGAWQQYVAKPTVIKNVSTTGVNVTISATFTTVNGASNYVLSTQGDAITLLPNTPDGTNWDYRLVSKSSAASAVTGSGTTGTLPKWTGAGALGDSVLSESGGGLVATGGLTLGGNLANTFYSANTGGSGLTASPDFELTDNVSGGVRARMQILNQSWFQLGTTSNHQMTFLVNGNRQWWMNASGVFYPESSGGQFGGASNRIGQSYFNSFWDMAGSSAPSVSSSGQGRIYFDSTANRFNCSEHGGSYFGCFAPFTGDSGSGGAKGFVPAPASGDAAAGKMLGAGGAWAVPSIGASTFLIQDFTLRRVSSSSLRFGAADAASAVAQTLGVQNVVAGTTDTAGADWTFQASRGTGTGGGGAIIFQTAKASTTGSTQNTLSTTLKLQPDGVVVVKTSVFASLPTVTNGGLIYCTDCTLASPCAGSGTGALAKGINGNWVCN